MIEYVKGNLLKSDAEALVNSVNCEGFMGKGIALQFKKAFPENFKAYQRACRRGEVRPGRMFVVPTGSMVNPKFIINFPTKLKWREKSRMEYIDAGLESLVGEVTRLGIKSIAIPPLGAGLGGLSWDQVRPRIEAALNKVSDVSTLLFEPAGPPAAEAMPVGTSRPRLTPARASILRLMQDYEVMAYRLSLLEIQKLAYFLQESGESLRLNYVAHVYGPYAHNLNKVLETLEGHFIRGYGDTQAPEAEIKLLPHAAEEAQRFLEGDSRSQERLRRVAALIEGFETPYGLELLSSVHWVATHDSAAANQSSAAVAAIQSWSDRKRAMFKPQHIELAWSRLREEGWFHRESAEALSN